MAKKEAKTNLWVYDLLKEANIELDAQGSSIIEIDRALKSASKRGTGKVGFPEYVGTVKDFIIVIEDKPAVDKHIKLEGALISMEINAVVDYAVNGALFYAQHLAKNTSYKKVLTLHDYNKNKFVSIFITNQIMIQGKNYNYSRKMGTQRLKKQKIMLPATSKGEPDYDYMEQYIKNVMIRKYGDYLQFALKGVL